MWWNYNATSSGQVLVSIVGSNFSTLLGVKPHAASGRLRVLAITAGKRTSTAPEIPTVAETGQGQVNVGMWFGVFAPKGMPADLVNSLNRDINQILAGEDVKTAFSTQGMDPATATPAEFARLVERDADKWARLVKAQGIKAE